MLNLNEESIAVFRNDNDGSSKVLKTIIKFYKTPLYAYCLRKLNKEDAEESTSDVFLALWKGRAKIKNAGHLESTLFKIAHDKCIDHLKKNNTERQRITDETYLSLIAAVDIEVTSLYHEDKEDKVRQELVNLKDPYRLAYYLRMYDNLSASEVAEIMKIKEKAVYNLWAEAKIKIRKALKNRNIIGYAVLLLSISSFFKKNAQYTGKNTHLAVSIYIREQSQQQKPYLLDIIKPVHLQ